MLPANEVEAMTDSAAASMIFFIIFSYIFRLDLSIPIDRMALVDLETIYICYILIYSS